MNLRAFTVGLSLFTALSSIQAEDSLLLKESVTEELQTIETDEQALLENIDALNPEYRKHLAYLYARLGKIHLAEPLASRVLEDEPDDKRLLLAMTSMYLEKRDPAKTEQYAKRILTEYPEDKEGTYFLATSQQLAKRPAEARNILLELKEAHKGDDPYPYEVDLASAANEAGDWQLAMESYITILRDYDLTPELRSQVRRALDQLYRTHNPQATARFHQIDYGSGTTTTHSAEYSQALSASARLIIELEHVSNTFEGNAIFTESTKENTHALVRLEQQFNRLYDIEVWGGAYADKPRAGTRIMRKLNSRGSKVGLSYDHARPSEDSQAMRYLEGRERRLSAHAELDLRHNYTLFVNAYARETLIGSDELGHGLGADWQLVYPIHHMDNLVFLSWRGAYATFSAKENNLSVLDELPYRSPLSRNSQEVNNLISDRIHRQGLGLLITRNLENKWLLNFTAGVDYYLYLSQFSWDVGTEILFRPRKSVEVSGQLIYSSSDNTGNQNAENIQIVLTVRKIF